MRASRLLSLVLLLQSRGRMTARQLSAELGVSVRTVYRDVESLGAAGVPLYGEPGQNGGFRLLDGYRTRLTGLTGDEAEALVLAGLPGPAADLGMGAVLATAQLKLMAALPPELRDRAASVGRRFHLDTSGWFADPEPTPFLPAVAAAVEQQHRVRVRYRRWAEPRTGTRVLDPYGVVLKGGRWYVVAATEHGVRTFRIAQILEFDVLPERFCLPDGFDLAAHWRAYLEDFDARRRRGEATVLLTRALLGRLPDLVEPAVVRAAEASATPVDPGDSVDRVRVVVPVESLEHAARMFLRLGPEAEVIAPDELRARLAAEATALAELYRSPVPAGWATLGFGT